LQVMYPGAGDQKVNINNSSCFFLFFRQHVVIKNLLQVQICIYSETDLLVLGTKDKLQTYLLIEHSSYSQCLQIV
jgi:hypothetical protein